MKTNMTIDRTFSLLSFLVALYVVMGCGTETGNYLTIQGTVPDSLSIRALIPGQSVANVPQVEQASIAIVVKDKNHGSSGTITLTDARLVLKKIKIKLADSDVDSPEKEEENEEVKFEGPYIVNFVSDTVTPELSSFQISPGTYKQIEIMLHKIDGNEKSNNNSSLVGQTDNLFDNSIYFAGTYSGTTLQGSVTAVPFTFSYDLTEEFKLTGTDETSQGFAIEPNKVNRIIVAFRLVKWFVFDNNKTNSDNVDFSMLTLSNGQIQLTKNAEDNNRKIRQVIRDNIKRSADYGKDSDSDGKLGSDEDDDSSTEDSNDD